MGSQVPPFKTQSVPLNEMWRRWPEISEWLVKGNSPNLAHHVVRRLKSHLRGPHGEEPCEGASWKPQYLPTPTPTPTMKLMPLLQLREGPSASTPQTDHSETLTVR